MKRAVTVIILIILLFAATIINVMMWPEAEKEDPLPPADNRTEAEKIMDSMSLEEKIGQMFIVRPDALDFSKSEATVSDSEAQGVKSVSSEMKEALKDYPVGGVILFSKNISDPNQLKEFNSEWHNAEGIPLFIAVDEEGGAVARVANTPGFDVPKYKNASVTSDADKMGHDIGAYLKEYGFNMDFAPVADVNSNPSNPVIGTRAFSSDPYVVKDKAKEMADALKAEGIIPVYKHFPGHGDTAEDSHVGIAVVHKNKSQLKETEWVPYMGTSPDAVMVGHISVPEEGIDIPSTLSYKAVTEWLRGEIGHKGLVITDSMSMGAITEAYGSEESALKAIEAGADIILMPVSLKKAYNAVLKAVNEGRIEESRINESVRRIIDAKLKAGII